MSTIRAGLAAVAWTPEPGMPLMGNFRDDYAARGTHDPLWAKALVLADAAGRRAAVLTVDACMLDRQNVALMRRRIAAQSAVAATNVLVHATHTHSGPATTGQLGMEALVAPHRERIERLLAQAASAVPLAESQLHEVTLAVGSTREDRLAFQRRLRRRDEATNPGANPSEARSHPSPGERITMNWEALQPGFDADQIAGPAGPTDPEVVCLVVERDGRPEAAVVHFALHPAMLAGDNWLYSADYPGYLAQALSRIRGPHFVTLFCNGCCGDVNHIDYRDPRQGRGHKMAERVGYMLAAAAHEAIRTAEPVAASPIRVLRQQVTLDRLRISEAQRRWCRDVLQRAQAQPARGRVDGLPDEYYARVRLEMAAREDEPDQVELMTIRIGDIALVGLPGEAFCQLGMEIKARSPARHTLVLGLANDAIGYLPTRSAFFEGGYETLPGSTFYQPGSGEKLVQAALAQLDQLWSDPSLPSR